MLEVKAKPRGEEDLSTRKEVTEKSKVTGEGTTTETPETTETTGKEDLEEMVRGEKEMVREEKEEMVREEKEMVREEKEMEREEKEKLLLETLYSLATWPSLLNMTT